MVLPGRSSPTTAPPPSRALTRFPRPCSLGRRSGGRRPGPSKRPDGREVQDHMRAVARIQRTVTDVQRRLIVDRLVEPELRSWVSPKTLGFASREPVEAVLVDGTLVLYDGGKIKPTDFHLVELKA